MYEYTYMIKEKKIIQYFIYVFQIIFYFSFSKETNYKYIFVITKFVLKFIKDLFNIKILIEIDCT
jgi:hypothetical protein